MEHIAHDETSFVRPAEVGEMELYHAKTWLGKYVFSQDAKTIAIQYAATAIAIGMGLGEVWQDAQLEEFFASELPIVADADILYTPHIKALLQREKIVITPHPKEFSALARLLPENAICVHSSLQRSKQTLDAIYTFDQ